MSNESFKKNVSFSAAVNEECGNNKSKKVEIKKEKRKLVIILGLLLVFISIVGIILSLTDIKNNDSSSKISYKTQYNILTDSSYRVHLKPNSLYNTPWLEEGYLYSAKLSDFAEFNFRSDAILTESANLSGEYSIIAILKGYRSTSDTNIPIYERQYTLKSGKIAKEKMSKASIREKVIVNPAIYKKIAEDAELLLGDNASKDFNLVFSGKYIIDSTEKSFSYKIAVPMEDDAFFSINKPQARSDKGGIGSKSEAKKISAFKNLFPHILLGLLGLLLIAFISLFTVTKVESLENQYKSTIKHLLRKYGNQMICVENLPKNETKEALKIKDIDSLIMLSEEMREPVLYSLDKDGMPESGRFYIFHREYIYFIEIPNPDTTLVV